MNEMHEANRKGWDAVSPYWQRKIDADGDWNKCHVEPERIFAPQELELLKNVSGQEACVLGSGDNMAVFALAGMGARVTSVDISQSQLDIAAGRARELGLDVAFIQSDVTDLSAIEGERFDLVYTGGHVAVWVSDLKTYYAEAVRILKRGGMFIVSEYHPFRRIWKELPDRLEQEFSYFDRGPHQYDRSEEVPDARPGTYPSYEFHWSMSDFSMAVLDAGCELVRMDEFGESPEGGEVAPTGGLPRSLLLVGRKR